MRWPDESGHGFFSVAGRAGDLGLILLLQSFADRGYSLRLCIFDTPEDALAELETIAARYLDEWFGLYSNAVSVTPEEAERTRQRRLHMAQTLIAEDPDRHMVVQIYGEETTSAIEEANML